MSSKKNTPPTTPPTEQAVTASNTDAIFDEVLRQIQASRQKAFAQVNAALIELYWQIGEIISHKVKTEAWGKGVVRELARYIAQNDPEAKGFSDKNLWRMKQFYETYQGEEKLAALTIKLPWTHNTMIFSRCNTKSGLHRLITHIDQIILYQRLEPIVILYL
ncbi:MAG: DUF1016 domain-containing protein [Symploca sp. SIO2E6]|nr:DUF1016 domain-containing protein [Symploca sp. SIO2E6]